MVFILCIRYYTDLFQVLRNLLKEEEAEWRHVGLKLGVPKAQLDSIQATNAHQGEAHAQCMTEMLSCWLQYMPKESQLDNIMAALSEIDENMADKLKEDYSRISQALSVAGNNLYSIENTCLWY